MSIPADEAAAYPVFTADQLNRLRAYGTVRSVRAGEVLFSPADETYDLLVVLSGEVEVTEESRGGRVRFKPHRLGSFVGELNLLTGQRPFHTARVVADAEILTISHAQLRVLLDHETEIADVLVRALIARRGRRVLGDVSSAAIEIIGTTQSAQTLALRTFLGRNTIAYRWVDADQVDGLDDYLSGVGVTRQDLPVVITPSRVLVRAGPAELGRVLGLVRRSEDDRLYDVVVVGAGPAGLAAAVYGASEGLDIAVFDGTAPGGQAGTSSRIENYLGFPDGISGAELTTRAAIQAQRFGARLTSPSRVDGISAAFDGFAVSLSGGGVVSARTVVAACGALYRRLPLANWGRLEGAGIYYAATYLEAGLSADTPVFVLGGGNSAGQAALFLAGRCPHVTIVIRRESLAATMSQYLIDRIAAHDRIDVAASSVVAAVNGLHHLESVELRDTRSGEVKWFVSRGLFCFIGAEPASGWLPEAVTRDENGFVLTDVGVPPDRAPARPRLPYETAMDGLFAAGDIRVGSMKRVAAAVGEGSSAIRSVHQYLAQFPDRDSVG
jgi:thioredoxin reductase (NADPH)